MLGYLKLKTELLCSTVPSFLGSTPCFFTARARAEQQSFPAVALAHITRALLEVVFPLRDTKV